ncbi:MULTISPECIES: glycosyltransferase family A protein [Priestia]|uniref:glycosyltransferase family 2 protein n=1 Tax=Priestia TaxID=2800373 RepID=UPI00064EB01E|nr:MULTISPECIES: glycosyltransferase family A protein [Priestia]AWD67010.1 glycosyltransferase family 2 protein [Priestia megaterium]KML27277.1 beta-glycosyltransferase [Priestia aryabhattai]KMN98858.1 beta-glycosyltransferase [Priestia aryabhattai]QDZ80719.1 glycosyltransferase family 2 protein [Priestia megaterium]
MVPTLTVFTPTYNRAYTLHLCYESLIRQTCRDFVWLIIDDGSSDNTKELVESWMKDNKISIRYYYQQNQGMHGAHNAAYELIDTELNVCIDSDDYMPDDAIEKITNFWSKHGSEKFSGIIGLDSYNDGAIVGTSLPKDIKHSTLFDLYNKHGVKGDKKLVYRTTLTKPYPYPLFQNERYVGLAYKYHMIDKQYELLLMNEVLCCVEYLPDGSSLNMLNQYRKNPRGFAFYRKELMSLPFGSMLFKFKQAVHYVSSSFISKNWLFLKETPSKSLTILAMPLGIALYFYITAKTKSIKI